MKAAGDIQIAQGQMGILLSEEYKQWAYAQKKGVFPDIVPSDKYWQEVAQKNSSSRFAAVEKVDKGKITLPAVVLDTADSTTNSLTLLENSDYQMNARVLRLLVGGINNKLLTGNRPVGSAKITISKKTGFIDYAINYALEEQINKESISKEALRLAFEQGKVRLFYKEIELTKHFGLYTSIRSSGIWHDSTRVRCELKKITATKMNAYVEWLKLPINQIWEIEILDDSRISWNIEMEISDRVQIEREQANIMLSENYLSWFAYNGDRGDFPEEFNEDYGGDWQSLWKASPKAGFMAVSAARNKNRFWPSILLDCPSQGKEYMNNIVNSDKLFEARVLQCVRVTPDDKSVFLPCKYTYFSGQIKINKL